MNKSEKDELMKKIEALTKSDFYEDSTYQLIASQTTESDKMRVRLRLEDRAEEVGAKTQYKKMLEAMKTDLANMRGLKTVYDIQTGSGDAGGMTHFSIEGTCYQNLACGKWTADERGVIYVQGTKVAMACPHPIMPLARLRNIETDEESIVLAWHRDGHWTERTVAKDVIASRSKIVGLASVGVLITTEQAPFLVQYLAELEARNDLPIIESTGKLGWHHDYRDFVPFLGDIRFDASSQFRPIFRSIHEVGDRNEWMGLILELRQTHKIEVKLLLAAAFASVLVKPLGCLPFAVDLWGQTEGGKTVTEMVAASVWADPSESKYIGDLKTTDVALEAKANMLNNLPMIIDDTSKTSKKISDNFEGVVYALCGGKGKSRSNKELGINRESSWSLVVITNGERPLSSYVHQGGAINRILEVPSAEHVYEDPQHVVEIVKNNFGFAGREFLNALTEIGLGKAKELYNDYCKQLYSEGRMQKQSQSLACLLTADNIATNYIFRDGAYINIDEAQEVLTDISEVSEEARCYRDLVDETQMNPAHFNVGAVDDGYSVEQWGILESNTVWLFSKFLNDFCQRRGYSRKSFVDWAARHGYLEVDSQGKKMVVRRYPPTGKPMRFYKLTLVYTDDDDKSVSVAPSVIGGVSSPAGPEEPKNPVKSRPDRLDRKLDFKPVTRLH